MACGPKCNWLCTGIPEAINLAQSHPQGRQKQGLVLYQVEEQVLLGELVPQQSRRRMHEGQAASGEKTQP